LYIGFELEAVLGFFMIPTTVGEWRKLLAQYPDDMRFELEVNGLYGSVDGVSLDVQQIRNGYDGTKCHYNYTDALVLNVDITG
jgi:hypothetical protein